MQEARQSTSSSPLPRLRRALLAVVLVAVLPIVVVLSWETSAQLREERARLDHQLAESADSVTTAVQGQLTSSLDALRVLSQSELFQQNRAVAWSRLLQGRPRSDWASVFLLDRDGNVVLDTGPPKRTAGMTDMMHGIAGQVVRSGEAAVSGYTPAADAPGSEVSIAMPVLQGSSVQYVLGARMTDSTWTRLFANLELPAEQEASLLDAKGRRIADSATGTHGDKIATDEEPVIAAWRTVQGAGWRVRVSVAAEPFRAKERETLWRALGVHGGAALLGVLLALAVGNSMLRTRRSDRRRL